MLKADIFGSGADIVVMIHDWFCDHTSYDLCRNFLDTDRFTFHLVDLRGYGLSKSLKGAYTLDEAYEDVKAYLTESCPGKVHLVGHSMSTLIVQKFIEKDTSLLKSAVMVGPVPPSGMDVPSDAMDFLRSICKSNLEGAYQAIGMMTSDRLNHAWAKFKVKRWFEVSTEQARLNYLEMFVTANFAESLEANGDQNLPVLIITGQHDAEAHLLDAMQKSLLKWFPKADLVEIPSSGHYPMQETPPYFATLLDQFHQKVG